MRDHFHLCATGYLLVALVLSGCTAPASKPSNHGEQGFKQAVFDEKTLNDYMNGANGEALRFYNARRSPTDTEGSVIVIGTDKNGEDDYGALSPHYRLSDKVVGTIVTYYVCTEARALESVQWVQEVGDASYAANFKEEDVKTLLAKKDCNGVKLTPLAVGDVGPWSMRMSAVKITAGGTTDLGAYVDCGDPCPTLCGSDERYYLNRR